ncbi:hypothetical protein [Bacillus sp. B1-b2]|uniref:hypothetical protein n=1 Tax=Bacillus sp. B1-b2 TaxID=2653201 RepID=UPI001261CE9B|nr:hypothetical protein [Bacillus sp. B1-b2]KAB7666783.1 hypothetical protein F9279_17055 [Bacillus sp. B1-b2]
MSWKSIITGVAVGVAASYVALKAISRNRSLTSDDILHIARVAFKEQGPINGSWINMKKETLLTPDQTYHVYRGGITRMNGSVKEVYEFVSDSTTGRILDVNKIS